MDATLIHCPSEHGHYGTYVKYLLDYVAHAQLDPAEVVDFGATFVSQQTRGRR